MIPKGYIVGMGRNPGEEKLVSHLYKGTFDDPGLPMCRRGWNRASGHDYSIFRGSVGEAGVCMVCMKRAMAGKDGVEDNKDRKTEWI